MHDSDLDMWEYWCDKHGYLIMLEKYYPSLLEKNELLRCAINQIKIAQSAINAEMRRLAP